jgi:hypothetical protein
MKQFVIRIACCLSIILLVVASGCITPPKENATASKPGSTPGGNQLIPGTTETPSYVTEVTPFVTGTPPGGYRTMVPVTPVPGSIYCRIYSTTHTFAYNKTAVAFNLQNPPMFINYTVKPSNVSYYQSYTSPITGEGDRVVLVDKYSPISWFEVTVRSKLTPDKIYLQDGFGKAKGYNEYLNRTLKIVNRDDMQIEFYGNNITATASVWVKPEGNFNDTTQFNRTTDCAYFATNPRDSLGDLTPTPTPTPTWTQV